MLGGTSYTLSDQSRLTLGLNLYMAINSHLTLNGDGTGITTSNETPTQTQLHGHVKYVFGPTGAGLFDVRGELLISGYAHLIIDGTSYTGGGGQSIPLIKYTSLAPGSSFVSNNVDISGFDMGLSPTLRYDADGVYLVLAGEGGGPSITAEPTSSPTMLPTSAPLAPTLPPTSVCSVFLFFVVSLAFQY